MFGHGLPTYLRTDCGADRNCAGTRYLACGIWKWWSWCITCCESGWAGDRQKYYSGDLGRVPQFCVLLAACAVRLGRCCKVSATPEGLRPRVLTRVEALWLVWGCVCHTIEEKKWCKLLLHVLSLLLVCLGCRCACDCCLVDRRWDPLAFVLESHLHKCSWAAGLSRQGVV